MSLIAVVVSMPAIAAQQQNQRGSGTARTNGRSSESEVNTSIRRSATSVIARSTAVNSRKNRPVVTARPVGARTVAVRSVRPVNTVNKSRAVSKPTAIRSAVNNSVIKPGAKFSRAGIARATAVFNDISKIGGGYSNCRDAYATCMDQFCANANDTYRRCFCSDRFQDFRDTSDRLDNVVKMLAEFQNVNLDAVDKTAAEVNAMYTATAGEQAIKRDTSAAQKLLDSIDDMLSGKPSAQQKTQKQSTGSLGVLDFSTFATSNDDIFGSSSSSIFGGSSAAPDMTTMEGKELYDSAAKQCSEIIRESCSSDAMFNLARSAYSIMITQDCNAFEKNINAKKTNVEETVRTAEKYLRDARLEEYRAHNSSDVNDCLSKVEEAMRQPTACGPNYEKCMDYSGLYINAVTGEPIYSQALFGLNKLIVLDGSMDVLGANPNFNKFLDDRKMLAESTLLNNCREIADTVWYEFKRSAIIQIAQAQDEKIQQIKDACVTTIKECYDKQSKDLKQLETGSEDSVILTSDAKTGNAEAITAAAARGICYEKVQACAALYGDPNGCEYDDATKQLTKAVAGKKCGLQALLAYVDTVDSVKVAEGCEAALRKYAHELCDPPVGSEEGVKYPDGCAPSRISKSELRAKMNMRMKTFCAQDLILGDESNTISESNAYNTNIMNMIIKDIYDEMGIVFTAGCEKDADFNGIWITPNDVAKPNIDMLAQEFYKKYYGKSITNLSQLNEFNLKETGWCVRADGKAQCEEVGGGAIYHEDSGECELPDTWYTGRCDDLGGSWIGEQCVVTVAGEGANN